MLEACASDVSAIAETLELATVPADLHSFDTPQEVLAFARRQRPDVAIVNAEVTGAHSLLGELRSLPQTSSLPVIAFAEEGLGAELADHVFPKPQDEAELMGVVAAVRFYWMAKASVPSQAPPAPAGASPPRRLPDVDLMALPIEPLEAYVLSMIDGVMDLEEISTAVARPLKEVRAIVGRLAALGAVAWHAPHPSMAPPASTAAPKPETASAELDRASSGVLGSAASSPEPTNAQPPVAAEGAGRELSEERKKIVDDALALLGEADHYELLGVPRETDKKTIRAAYFRLAKLFHTDTVYGARLGEYRERMDRVFQALTEAYETLSKKRRRRDYDAYLEAVEETRVLDAPPEPRPSMVPAERRRESAAEEPSTASARSTAARRREVAQSLLTHRRRSLERAARPAGGAPSGAAADPRAAVQSLARTLKAMTGASGREDRVARLVHDARKAAAEGNLPGAAEALRIASAWRPEDEALAEEAARVRHEALVATVPAFERRARYAEQHGNWAEAALAWARVAQVRPDDGPAALGTARALLESQGDLKEASRAGKRAVELLPADVEAYLVLARIYLAAGMPSSARSILGRAQKVKPDDRTVEALLAELSES